MSDCRMPEEFYKLVEPHLPPDTPVGRQGGRPRIPNACVLKVLWYVLITGCRWEDVPLELGCSGRTAHRRLRHWQALGLWDRLHVHLLKLLQRDGKLDTDVTIVDSVIVRAFGAGEATGPSPVDRGKAGSKHSLLVDRNGVPLAIRTTGANVSDQKMIVSMVLDFPRVGGRPGRPKELPDAVFADRGYDDDSARLLLSWMGVEPVIARRGTEHGSGLGRVRWVVERTISWLKGLRRMRVRYDRLATIQDAWNTIAASVICFRIWTHDIR